jgi:hypothetical protein
MNLLNKERPTTNYNNNNYSGCPLPPAEPYTCPVAKLASPAASYT